MKICPHCGQPMDDDRSTCPMCYQSVDTKEPNESPIEEDGEENLRKEKRLISILNNLVTSKRFWMITAYVIAGLLTVIWGGQAISKLLEPKADVVKTQAIEPEVKSKLDDLVEEILIEKLDWGKDVMRLRLPTRFPEELILDSKQEEAEINFTKPDKTSVSYEFQVCFHFDNDVEETYQWVPVTFYFELRDNKWAFIGENWIRDSEMMFE